ncbi:hypothetical protein [Rhodococcus globerulus]|uniref:hypothetical protein n=1 Tax=Rhodococcus globerulus TaxID=33008 RepID=UPI000525BE21|nr:hypothetical protein [Rhodococcus globerulus]PVX59592.1 hypothetical protein C8E04_6166 [Rhodococcus globerulus]
MHELIAAINQERLIEVVVWPNQPRPPFADGPSSVGSVFADSEMLAVRIDSGRWLVQTTTTAEYDGLDVTDVWIRLVVPAEVADEAWASACALDRQIVERDRRAVFTRFARIRALVLPASVLRSTGGTETGFQVWLSASYGEHVLRWLEEDLGALETPVPSA